MTDRRRVRQIVSAYALLFGFAWVAWALVLSTIWTALGQHVATTRVLEQKLEQQQKQSRRQANQVEQLQNGLSAALANGQVSTAEEANLVNHQLQEAIKEIFARHGAAISSLSPSTDSRDEGLSRARLEINFNVSGARVDDLLWSLESVKPTLHFEVLSLRRVDRAQAGKGDFQLEVNLVLYVVYLNPAFRDNLVHQGINSMVFQTPIVAAVEPIKPVLERPVSANIVGLFDAEIRRRLQNPSADQYRLSAISLSSTARVAVIADIVTGTSHRVREGDSIHAWRIESIAANQVELVSGQQRIQLALPAEN